MDSIAVTGPDDQGHVTLTIAGVNVWLQRFVVEDLIWELQRRLALRI